MREQNFLAYLTIHGMSLKDALRENFINQRILHGMSLKDVLRENFINQQILMQGIWWPNDRELLDSRLRGPGLKTHCIRIISLSKTH